MILSCHHYLKSLSWRLDNVMCTKYQIVELAKESLPIDLLWWIEAVPSLIPKQTSCKEGAEPEMQAQECNQWPKMSHDTQSYDVMSDLLWVESILTTSARPSLAFPYSMPQLPERERNWSSSTDYGRSVGSGPTVLYYYTKQPSKFAKVGTCIISMPVVLRIANFSPCLQIGPYYANLHHQIRSIIV